MLIALSPDLVSLMTDDIGMISHKKSQITTFGHRHKIKNFIIKKFDIFHENISTATDFSSYFGTATAI